MPPTRQPTTISAPSGGGIQNRAKNLIVEAKTKLSRSASMTGMRNELPTFSANSRDKIRTQVNAMDRTVRGSEIVATSGISCGWAVGGSSGSSTGRGIWGAFTGKVVSPYKFRFIDESPLKALLRSTYL